MLSSWIMQSILTLGVLQWNALNEHVLEFAWTIFSFLPSKGVILKKEVVRCKHLHNEDSPSVGSSPVLGLSLIFDGRPENGADIILFNSFPIDTSWLAKAKSESITHTHIYVG